MSNQVSSTSANDMVDILALLEAGYGAQLQNNISQSPGSTPRSDAASTPTRHTETMQRLRDLARGVQSSFNNVMCYLRDDRSAHGGSDDGASSSLWVTVPCILHALYSDPQTPVSHLFLNSLCLWLLCVWFGLIRRCEEAASWFALLPLLLPR